MQLINIIESPQYLDTFIHYGLTMSRGYPNSIPHFGAAEKDTLKNGVEFITKGGGCFASWILIDNGKVKGRIAAMINHGVGDHSNKLGYIGFFDVDENYSFAKHILDAAMSWLKNIGCIRIHGPVNFSIWHSYRFMTDGFDTTPFYGEPKNYPYYPDFFLKYGFKKYCEWETYKVDNTGIRKIISRYQDHTGMFQELGYQRVFINEKNATEMLHVAYDLFTDIYQVLPDYSFISKEEFLWLFNGTHKFMHPEATCFVKNKNGKYIAFILTFHDYTAAIRSMKGNANLWAKIRFLFNKNKGSCANIYQGGVMIEAIRQAMKEGLEKFGTPFSIGRAGFCFSLMAIENDKRYETAMMTMVREEAPNKNYIKNAAFEIRKYALYEFDCNENKL